MNDDKKYSYIVIPILAKLVKYTSTWLILSQVKNV